MHLDSGVSVRADTHAVVISPSLVSDRYVQLTGVYDSGPKLPTARRSRLSRTATSVEIDQLNTGIVKLTQALGPERREQDRRLSPTCSTSARRTCVATVPR